MRTPEPPPLSLRARLTLGNVLIFGAILAVLAIFLRYGAQVWLAADQDRDLAGRAQRFAGRAAAQYEARQGAPPPPPRPAEAVPSPTPTPQQSPSPTRIPSRLLDRKSNSLISGQPEKPYDEGAFGLSLRGESVYRTRDLEGEPVRLYSIPIKTSDRKVIGVVQAATPMADMNAELARLTRLLLTLVPVALLAATAGGFLMTARALNPVREITEAAERIEAGNLSDRLPVAGRDEFAVMAATFNRMLSRLERSFERQRRFTADASHELRTPLAAIKWDVSLMLSGERERTALEYRHALEDVSRAADRMDRIVEDLLLLARSEGRRLPLDLQLLAIGDVMRGAQRAVEAAALRPGAPAANAPIHLVLPVGESLHVVGDLHHLERLFVNLLSNARRHTPPEGKITFAARAEDESLILTVVDTGEGIAPEHLPYVFDSFYRADSARSRASGGTGLGLAIARSITEAHGGSISLASVPDQGTTVTVSLPKAQIDV